MIHVIISNTDSYKLSVTKKECEKPRGLTELILTEEYKTSEGSPAEVREHSFYLNEEQLSYMARALIV
jgi:hypothetical protein